MAGKEDLGHKAAVIVYQDRLADYNAAQKYCNTVLESTSRSDAPELVAAVKELKRLGMRLKNASLVSAGLGPSKMVAR